MLELTYVPKDVWIPVFAKAIETKRKDAQIIDIEAVEITKEALRFMPSLKKVFDTIPAKSKASTVGRTILVDKIVQAYVERNPDAIIVNLGAGLCTRFEKLDNGLLSWIELDLPEVGKIWNYFYHATPRHQFWAYDLHEDDWISRLKTFSEGKPMLFLAENVLMYCSKEANKNLLGKMAANFPTSEIWFESHSFWMQQLKSLTDGKPDNFCAIETGKEIEKWHNNIKFVEEKPIWTIPSAIKRLPLAIQAFSFLPAFRRLSQFVHLKFR